MTIEAQAHVQQVENNLTAQAQQHVMQVEQLDTASRRSNQTDSRACRGDT